MLKICNPGSVGIFLYRIDLEFGGVYKNYLMLGYDIRWPLFCVHRSPQAQGLLPIRSGVYSGKCLLPRTIPHSRGLGYPVFHRRLTGEVDFAFTASLYSQPLFFVFFFGCMSIYYFVYLYHRPVHCVIKKNIFITCVDVAYCILYPPPPHPE